MTKEDKDAAIKAIDDLPYLYDDGINHEIEFLVKMQCIKAIEKLKTGSSTVTYMPNPIFVCKNCGRVNFSGGYTCQQCGNPLIN